MIQIFRVFFPSWKFFDIHDEAPELYYRLSEDGKNFGPWMICIPKTGKRSLKNLFINSRENFLFASHALVEYLKNDIQEEADAFTSLALVQNLVRFQMNARTETSPYFQFRLAVPTRTNEPLYTSALLRAKDGVKS